MTIYTRFSPCEIVEYHGMYKPKYLTARGTLVTVKLIAEDTQEKHSRTYYWAEFLRATNGAEEIDKAIRKAPYRELSIKERAEAFRQAE